MYLRKVITFSLSLSLSLSFFSPGELHLTPLHDIIQLRPRLDHLDTASTHQGVAGGGGVSDGDTTATESEGEEAKPVTVSCQELLLFNQWQC